jgi:hypothetical protein
MADAGINPEAAYTFWSSVQNDNRFGGNSFEFFSSHPASQTRLNQIRALLPAAIERFKFPRQKQARIEVREKRLETREFQARRRDNSDNERRRLQKRSEPYEDRPRQAPPRYPGRIQAETLRETSQNDTLRNSRTQASPEMIGAIDSDQRFSQFTETNKRLWIIKSSEVNVYKNSRNDSKPLATLRKFDAVEAFCRKGQWLKIANRETQGFIELKSAIPQFEEGSSIKRCVN